MLRATMFFDEHEGLSVDKLNAIMDYLETTINNLRGINFKSVSVDNIIDGTSVPGVVSRNGGSMQGDMVCTPSVTIDGYDISELAGKAERAKNALLKSQTFVVSPRFNWDKLGVILPLWRTYFWRQRALFRMATEAAVGSSWGHSLVAHYDAGVRDRTGWIFIVPRFAFDEGGV